MKRYSVTLVHDSSWEILTLIVQRKTLEKSIGYTDDRWAYDGFVLNGYDHYCVFHGENEFARCKNHVNGVENFWI